MRPITGINWIENDGFFQLGIDVRIASKIKGAMS